jgi:ferredoxin
MCEEAAPELFEIRPDGMLHVLDQEPPTHLLAAAQRAVRSCPTAALRLEP